MGHNGEKRGLRWAGAEKKAVRGNRMYEVIYFSRWGNTRKVAAAIADELKVKPVIYGR